MALQELARPESMIADHAANAIGMARLALIAFALALSAAAHGVERTAYLPPREAAPVKGSRLC